MIKFSCLKFGCGALVPNSDIMSWNTTDWAISHVDFWESSESSDPSTIHLCHVLFDNCNLLISVPCHVVYEMRNESKIKIKLFDGSKMLIILC